MTEFFTAAFSSPLGASVVLLTLGLLFVNGWTDAPNAIAAAVATRAVSLRQGIFLATFMNLIGGVLTLTLGRQVAYTVFALGNFPPGHSGSVGLAAGMAAVILWAVIAWRFGIPTSESHGLMAGLMGSALALNTAGISLPALSKVLAGLIFSIGLGLLGGWAFSRLLSGAPAKGRFWRWGQIISAGAMAFCHGLQDTPKFASILILGMTLWGEESTFTLPLWAPLLCGFIMSLGTLLGGGRIIKKVGSEMVHINLKEGFAADLAGTLTLLLSTLQGFPVSTTHAKTTALMGAALGGEERFVDKKIAGTMFLSWLITFPFCGLLAYIFTKILLFF